MREIVGGCLCGQIRYAANAEPAFVGVCHCKNCQKQTGTAFSVLVGIPKSAMTIRGRIKTFEDTGGSGLAVRRNFCPECGSRLFGGKSDFGLGIAAGTLDDPSVYKPLHELWTSDAQPWDYMDPNLPKFEKYPNPVCCEAMKRMSSVFCPQNQPALHRSLPSRELLTPASSERVTTWFRGGSLRIALGRLHGLLGSEQPSSVVDGARLLSL